MPVCPTCGKTFSGFSFGSTPATECADCRRAKKQTAVIASASVPVSAQEAAVPLVPMPVVTYSVIGVNVLVYLAMSFSGASWSEPSIQDAIRWGADFGPLTLSGEPWRLFTSTFVHFGIIHIAFNMWCLLDLGRSLEYVMGRKAFAAAYLVSGLVASTVSVWWNPWRISAGASGAIFGVAGAFASYLYVKKVTINPAAIRQSRRSLAIFISSTI